MQGEVTADDRLWALLSYLLSLVAAILAPLIIFLIKKEQSRFVAFHALQSLFFDLAVVVVMGILWVLTIVAAFTPLGAIACLLMPLMGVVGIGAFVYKILIAIKANNGEWAEIPNIGPLARRQVGL